MSMFDAIVQTENTYAPTYMEPNVKDSIDALDSIQVSISDLVKSSMIDSVPVDSSLSRLVVKNLSDKVFEDIDKRLAELKERFDSVEIKSKEDYYDFTADVVEEYRKFINEELSSSITDVMNEISQESKGLSSQLRIRDVADRILHNENVSRSDLPKFDREVENARILIKDSAEYFKDSVKEIEEDFKYGHSVDTVLTDLASPFIQSYSSIVSNLLTSPISTLKRSDTVKLIERPTAFVKELSDIVVGGITESVNNLVNTVADAPIEFVDDITNTITDTLRDFAHAVTDSVASKIDMVSDGIRDSFETKSASISESIKDTFETGFTRLTSISMHSDVNGIDPSKGTKRTARTVDNPPTRDSFMVNKSVSGIDLSMVNDAYWDILIVPHRFGNSEPPSINVCFGRNDEKGRLPIVSFNLDAGGLYNSSYEIFPGVTMNIPNIYNRPASLNVSVVNLYRKHIGTDSIVSCLEYFKDSYLQYVLGSTENGVMELDKLPAFRDYHYCAYEINVIKFTPQWEVLKTWHLLGIPVINYNESGGSYSQQEIQNLTFSVVGQGSSS